MLPDAWNTNYLSLLPRDVLALTLTCSSPLQRKVFFHLSSPFRVTALQVETHWKLNAFAPEFIQRTYIVYTLEHSEIESKMIEKCLSPCSSNEVRITENRNARKTIQKELAALINQKKYHLVLDLQKKTSSSLYAHLVDAFTFGQITQLKERYRELRREQKTIYLEHIQLVKYRSQLLTLINEIAESFLDEQIPGFKEHLEEKRNKKTFILSLFRVPDEDLIPFYSLEEPYFPGKYYQSQLIAKLRRCIQFDKVTAPLMKVDLSPRHWVLLFKSSKGAEMFILTIFKKAILFVPLAQEALPLTIVQGAKLNLVTYQHVKTIISKTLLL